MASDHTRYFSPSNPDLFIASEWITSARGKHAPTLALVYGIGVFACREAELAYLNHCSIPDLGKELWRELVRMDLVSGEAPPVPSTTEALRRLRKLSEGSLAPR